MVPALVAAVGVASTPSLAHAADVEQVSVTYVAAKECPSREEQFVESVRRYTTRWRVVDPSPNVRKFRIVLEKNRGELVIESRLGGTVTRREIVAPDCERVARGLAIAMALAINPEADITGGRPEGEAPNEEPKGDTTEPPPAPPSSAPPSSAPPAPPQPAEVTAPTTGAAPAPSPRREDLSFAVEARAEITSALTTSLAPVFGAAVEVRATPAAFPEWLAPALAVGLRQSWPIVVAARPGRSEFSWTAATFRLCPVRLHFGSTRLDATPCAEGNVGVLRARALPDGREAPSDWFDLGGSLRVVYRVARSWGVGGTALVSAPFVRHRFAVVGDGVISQAPAVGISGGLLVELRL